MISPHASIFKGFFFKGKLKSTVNTNKCTTNNKVNYYSDLRMVKLNGEQPPTHFIALTNFDLAGSNYECDAN